jgi:hypothetical protein
MVRGVERTTLIRDDWDRADFVARVGGLAADGAWTVYAWTLLANHAHRLVRTGQRPLTRSMRFLLTGCAGAFNRRHHRVGHLVQNRFGNPPPAGAGRGVVATCSAITVGYL